VTLTHFQQQHELQHAVKKIRTILANKSGKDDDGLEELIMIDTIKRLGLDHYFQEEIRAILAKHNSEWRTLDKEGGGRDLYEVALRFRLLRQEGYHVTSGELYSLAKYLNNVGHSLHLLRRIKNLWCLNQVMPFQSKVFCSCFGSQSGYAKSFQANKLQLRKWLQRIWTR